MKLLLYCICEAQAEVVAAAGVRGAAVRAIVVDGLRCFCSEVGELGGDAGAAQKDALDYHRVTHGIFQSAAIIPFRFPTLLQNADEVVAFLRPEAREYAEELARLRDAVQMEARISLAAAAEQATSGAEYLRVRAAIAARLEEAAACCKNAAFTLEWRQRTSRDGVHCFALVRRGEVYNFEQALRGLRLDPALTVIVSGPWPATEFMNVAQADSSGTKVPSE